MKLAGYASFRWIFYFLIKRCQFDSASMLIWLCLAVYLDLAHLSVSLALALPWCFFGFGPALVLIWL
jgi:hypothetical protein